ncbi:eukaryotic translation initiation factor 3 subunit J-B isoform X1, partial [Tachysurus ichikawai]
MADSDSWDADNFEADEPIKRPTGLQDRWEGEDEEDDVKDNWDDDEEEEKKKEEEKEEVEKKTGVVSGLEPSTSDTLWPHDRLIFLITTDDDDNIQSMNANN